MCIFGIAGYCQNAHQVYQITLLLVACEQPFSSIPLAELVLLDLKYFLSQSVSKLFCSIDLFLIRMPIPH